MRRLQTIWVADAAHVCFRPHLYACYACIFHVSALFSPTYLIILNSVSQNRAGQIRFG